MSIGGCQGPTKRSLHPVLGGCGDAARLSSAPGAAFGTRHSAWFIYRQDSAKGWRALLVLFRQHDTGFQTLRELCGVAQFDPPPQAFRNGLDD
jgi:hypothetical protein